MFKDEKGKQVHMKMGWLLKQEEMLEDKKVKRLRTYADVVSTRRATGHFSNGEEGSKF